MTKRKFILVLILVGLYLGSANYSSAQTPSQAEEKILQLMEEIFNQIVTDVPEIDPNLGRIAVYRLEVDNKHISTHMREHFEGRLVEILRNLEHPALVALPEFNTLKITSNDTSFSITNTLPTPDELGRIGRRLRIDAFIEGNLVYLPERALLLDLRLNRTGTNEVLWAKSYSAFEKQLQLPAVNPLKKSLNGGLEIFQLTFKSDVDSLLHQDSKDRLIHYSIYFGLYQFITPKSRLRYELRLGLSFLSEGVKLRNNKFQTDTFYSNTTGTQASRLSSVNVRSLIVSTIAENKGNPSGDWLAVYFAATRYFTVNMPDLTGIGVGIRSDINSHFSLSAGLSAILGREFDSVPIRSTGERIRLRVRGLHYEFLFLQYTL